MTKDEIIKGAIEHLKTIDPNLNPEKTNDWMNKRYDTLKTMTENGIISSEDFKLITENPELFVGIKGDNS